MPERNPYEAPEARVEDLSVEASEYDPLDMFALSGRIGRLRLFVWQAMVSLISSVLVGAVAGVLLAAGFREGDAALDLVTAIVQIAAVAVGVIFAAKRARDFNVTGWLGLLIMIPIVNLFFFFVPGTDGPNKFGPPPPPNSTGVKVLAGILIALIVLVVVALIVVAATGYSEYLEANPG